MGWRVYSGTIDHRVEINIVKQREGSWKEGGNWK